MALRITDPNEMAFFEKIAQKQAPNNEQRNAEHKLMLDELKRQYNAEGEIYIGELIRKIDPEWKSKWDLRREQDLDELYCYECGIHDCIPHFGF